MKFLKILGIVIAIILAVFFVGALFLPKTYSVSRSITINAPDSVIYKNISNFKEFLKWNPWSKMEPSARVTISGPVGQPDYLYQWEGKETGKGQMKVKSVEVNKMVDIELKFIEPMETIADTRFDIAPEGTANKVTWTMAGEADGIISKWMCLMMDGMIGKDFEDGLKFLKEKSELKN